MDEKKKIDVDVNVNVTGKDSIDSTKESLEGLAGSGKKLPGVFGEVAEGAIGLAEGIGSATKAALAFMATPIGLVLGALAVAIGSVKAAFESSEEGQNKFAKIMSVIGSVVQKVIDVFAQIGDIIIDAFEHPVEYIKKFAELIKQNVINRFEGLLELIPNLGKAVSELFHGNFKEAGKIATDSLAKVSLGVDHVTDRIEAAAAAAKKWGEDVKVAADRAAKVADMRAKAEKEEREFSGKKLELEAKIAKLREDMADKDNFSASERKKFAKEALSLDEELFAEEKKLADQRKEATHLELDWRKASGKLNKEQLKQLQEVDDKSTEVDIERAKSGKTLTKALLGTEREIRAAEKAAAAEKAKEAKEYAKTIKDLNKKELKGEQEVSKGVLTELDKKKQAVQDAYDNDSAALQDLLDNNKIKQADFDKFSLALEKKRLGEVAILEKEAKDKYDKEKREYEKKKELESLETEKATLQAKTDLAILAAKDDALKILEIKDQELKDEYFLAVEAAIAKGEDISKIDLEYQAKLQKNAEETAKKKKEIAKQEAEGEKAIASELESSLQGLSDITFDVMNSNLKKGSAEQLAAAKKQFKINKALSLTSAIITGVEGAMNAYTSAAAIPVIGWIAGPIAAIAAGIAAAANVAKISSQQFSETGGASGGGASGARGANPLGALTSAQSMIAPTLTKVGNKNTNMPTGGATGKGGINTKPQPIKAIVVSTDMTKQQNSDAAVQRRAKIR